MPGVNTYSLTGRALHGLAARLAVDRPGRAVIMRIAVLGAVIDMAEDAEAEFGILVQNLALGHLVAEIGVDEIVVLQHVLDQRAHPLAPFDARILLEDPAAFRRKLLERISHRQPP